MPVVRDFGDTPALADMGRNPALRPGTDSFGHWFDRTVQKRDKIRFEDRVKESDAEHGKFEVEK